MRDTGYRMSSKSHGLTPLRFWQFCAIYFQKNTIFFWNKRATKPTAEYLIKPMETTFSEALGTGALRQLKVRSCSQMKRNEIKSARTTLARTTTLCLRNTSWPVSSSWLMFCIWFLGCMEGVFSWSVCCILDRIGWTRTLITSMCIIYKQSNNINL